MIFVGFDHSKSEGGKSLSESIASTYWDAFGDLLDEVFCQAIHNYMKA